MAVKPKDLPLPKGMKIPEHQVTGHMFGSGKTKLGLLECSDGSIVKPCESPVRGRRERSFYQQVFDSVADNDENLLALRKCLPEFLGVFAVEEHPDIPYLHMENIVRGLRHPCVMDVKIGARSYDPLASPGKIAKETNKCPAQTSLGFRLSGMRVYRLGSDDYFVPEKRALQATTPQSLVTNMLPSYLSSCRGLRVTVLMSFLRQLARVYSWFTRQRTYAFFCTSLFFVYEGDLESQQVSPLCPRCTQLANRCLNTLQTQGQVNTKPPDVGHVSVAHNGGRESIRSQDKSDVHSSKHLKSDQISHNTLANAEKNGYNSSHTCDTTTESLQSLYLCSDTFLPCMSAAILEHFLFEVSTPEAACESCDHLARVKMIDFAHVFESDSIDEHYLHGLRNVIVYFILMLQH